MKKSEILAELIHLPVEAIENEVDKGMWDILIELNKKNYFTVYCCEGHLNTEDKWNAYITFVHAYKFKEYPKNYDSAKNRKAFYWSGKGEESRQEFLENLLLWAKLLPKRNVVEEKMYTLMGKNKRRANGQFKTLKLSNNYEDIRIELNKKGMDRYELKLLENVCRRY